VRALQARGIKVFITDGTPDFLFDPALCKFDGECAEPAEGFEKRYDTYAVDLDDVVSDAPGLELIKTAELLCNAQECAMGTTGKLYFRDFHHLNIPGSQFVGAEIVRRHPSLAK
jgi:hypothetical protein